MQIPALSPRILFEELVSPSAPILIDVREEDEREISVLEGDLHIPMNEISSRLPEIPKDRKVVIYCRSGHRSGLVVNYLRAIGFDDVWNLAGGINRWAFEIDPTMRQY